LNQTKEKKYLDEANEVPSIRRRKGCKVIANCEHLEEKHYAKVGEVL